VSSVALLKVTKVGEANLLFKRTRAEDEKENFPKQ
jgi:hypothetical protein